MSLRRNTEATVLFLRLGHGTAAHCPFCAEYTNQTAVIFFISAIYSCARLACLELLLSLLLLPGMQRQGIDGSIIVHVNVTQSTISYHSEVTVIILHYKFYLNPQ